MKKIFYILMCTGIVHAYAMGSVSANFYTVIVNQSSNFDVSVWEKNGLYWSNWGWCDGANDSNTPLSVPAGQTKVYCGGNTLNADKIPSDSPHIQHEWWFANHGQNNWWQNYSQQWLLYNFADNCSASPFACNGFAEILKITELSVPQNNWGSAIPLTSTAYGDSDHIYPTLSADFISVYTIHDDRTMSLQQYRAAYGAVKDYNELKQDPYAYEFFYDGPTQISF